MLCASSWRSATSLTDLRTNPLDVVEYGVPKYVICPCCYNESGIGDDNVSQVRELRGYWVASGAQWHDPKFRSADWDLLTQLANIPPEWR